MSFLLSLVIFFSSHTLHIGTEKSQARSACMVISNSLYHKLCCKKTKRPLTRLLLSECEIDKTYTSTQ